MRGRATVALGLIWLALAGCGRRAPARALELDAIRISGDVRLRTDTVGDGKFASTSSFVLVDAENTSPTGAYVTLGGELTGSGGATLGTLRAQSLWIPGREARLFALVDRERVPRPGSAAARIKVYGAVIPDEPPRAHIEELHTFDDHGQLVLQAYAVNAADRPGQVMVVGAFHDAHDLPLTRPFQMIELAARDRRFVQFVGPPGAARGAVFVADAVY